MNAGRVQDQVGVFMCKRAGAIRSCGRKHYVVDRFRDEEDYEEKICRLDPGDLLLLFSDGVTESRKPVVDEEFGEERLAALLRNQQGQPAAAVLDAIKAEIVAFTGGTPAADDVTLVSACGL